MTGPKTTGHKTTGLRRRRLAAVLLLGTALLGNAMQPAAAAPAPAANAAAAPSVQSAGFADLAERVGAAVVNVSTTRAASAAEIRRDDLPPGAEEFMRRFFGGEPEGEGPDGAEPRQGERSATALGSGFVIDPAGYVVTNNHVVDGAEKTWVTLRDGTRLEARLVGRDPKTDLALLKVEAPAPLPSVEFGDSDALRVGDWVVAVGNPFGLGGTVTAGIVSARGRDIHSGPYDDFIQIDASINQGNSGGPTFDLSGRVVGINTAIFSPNGGSVGIGFAIPSNLARKVVADLRAHGSVERGWLGVQIQEVTREIADGLGLADAKGALVSQVTPGGPAAQAGLLNGDVVRRFDGRPIDGPKDLSRRVADAPAGHAAELEVWRRGRAEAVRVTLARLDDGAAKLASADRPGAQAPGATAEVLGMRLSALDARTRKRLRLPEGVDGVAILGVEDGRAGADGRVQAGDVIVEVAERPVREPREVASAVDAAREAGRRAVLLRVHRAGAERYVALALAPA